METERQFEYDFFVIGGGSGGISAAKAAALNGAKVALADFVKPSPQGTKWGLGGTCVNVGCIPKKLMHFSALIGEMRHDQKGFGLISNANQPHNWQEMLMKVNNYIKSLNWGYRTDLSDKDVEYFDALAKVTGPNTIELNFAKKPPRTITAQHILIATGGRPMLFELPGAKENCITSDDIFWKKTPPGKCLVIGAGYIGLECGGFLRGMGYPVDILHRAAILRGFDTEMVDRVVHFMKNITKVNFVQGNPLSFEKEGDKIKATWITDKKETVSQLYDSVLMATGRYPDVKAIGLEALNVKLDKSGKIIVNDKYETSSPSIFAIGDIVSDGRELTPVAIRQGISLSNGLFKQNWTQIDLKAVATTVFTPLEYACSGHSEEEAISEFGKEHINVYVNEFTPSEWQLTEEKSSLKCLMKVITLKTDETVIGIHYTGPNSGEIMQGLSMLVRLKLKLEDLKNVVPLSNTFSEVVFELHKRA